MPTSRIIFLDYLRIYAFASVLIGHKFYEPLAEYANSINIQHITLQYMRNIFLAIFYGGGAGVIVFFLISGYIITYVLQQEKPLEFLIKRFFRIYPLLILAITCEYILNFYCFNIPIDISKMIIQITLLGDFFSVPYALAGVEWTLRVEILFYIFMALLTKVKFWKLSGVVQILIFSLCILAINILAPFPNFQDFASCYFSLYAPFLFLGSAFFMLQNRYIDKMVFVLFTILVFANCFYLTLVFKPISLTTNFVIVGFLIFLFFYLKRNNLFFGVKINTTIINLSSLTYSIYLFHNFLWIFIQKLLALFFITSDFMILFILFIFCYFINKLIEMPLNKFGHKVATKCI